MTNALRTPTPTRPRPTSVRCSVCQDQVPVIDGSASKALTEHYVARGHAG